jgi:hypothetical protein
MVVGSILVALEVAILEGSPGSSDPRHSAISFAQLHGVGMPCGKYLVIMLGVLLPLLAAAGDLDKPFATEQASAEL